MHMSHYVKVIMGNICVTLTSLSKVKHIFGQESLGKRIALCLIGWPNNPCADPGSYVMGGPKLIYIFF